MMRNHEAFENAAKAEVARLQAAAKSAASRATWLKSYIHAQMNRVGMKSVRTVQGTCSIMPGVATVVVDDVLVLPDDCVEYVPENAYVPKKDVILKRLKALEEGEVFSGAHLNDPVEYLKITRTGKAEE
jgi:hypothetical protein